MSEQVKEAVWAESLLAVCLQVTVLGRPRAPLGTVGLREEGPAGGGQPHSELEEGEEEEEEQRRKRERGHRTKRRGRGGRRAL